MSLVLIHQTALSHSKKLSFAGAACDLSTTSAHFAAMLESLSLLRDMQESRQFSMKIVVDKASTEAIGSPHFRGMHHVVMASFGTANVFIFDILRRTLSAKVSAAVARDVKFWKEKLIPITLGVLGASIGLVPVHCACLESEGDGLLIAGESGAGKSTLSVALSQGGFNYVSDDWTYLSRQGGRLVAHGTAAPVKLLPDAARHFERLGRHEVHISMNGELAYEVDVKDVFGARVESGCEPRWLLFLERTERAEGEFIRLSSDKARKYLDSSVERLPERLSLASDTRQSIIESISRLPCWNFRYGGTPQFATEQLYQFIARQRQRIDI